jgi:hypothetical protein
LPTIKVYQKRHPLAQDAFVPAYGTDENSRLRLHHRDLGDLESDRLWAEAEVLSAELARRIFENDRPYGFGDPAITDREWLRCRISRLRAELARRQRLAA